MPICLASHQNYNRFYYYGNGLQVLALIGLITHELFQAFEQPTWVHWGSLFVMSSIVMLKVICFCSNKSFKPQDKKSHNCKDIKLLPAQLYLANLPLPCNISKAQHENLN
jgi:hypothetical protein